MRYNKSSFKININILNITQNASNQRFMETKKNTWEQLMLEQLGYECKTTFWNDFSIADKFGADSIRDTYKRSFDSWKDNVVYITELVLVLNHKIWYWYEKNEELSRLYNDLWMELDEWCGENLKDKDAEYYYRVTD